MRALLIYIVMFTDEEIRWMNEDPVSRAKKSLIKERWPQEYEEIIKLEGRTWHHKLYNYLHPGPHVCKICGKPVIFMSYALGYHTYCSTSCSKKDPEVQAKSKATCQERYGADNPMASKIVRQKRKETCERLYGTEFPLQNPELMARAKATYMERYGVDNPFRSKELMKESRERRDEEAIRAKARATCMERYGVSNPLQSEEFRAKSRTTCMERYGVPNITMTNEFRARTRERIRRKIMEEHPDIIYIDDEGNYTCKCPHPECDKCQEKTYIIGPVRYYGRIKQHTEPCTKILPIQGPRASTLEIEVRRWLDEAGIEYETNNRKIVARTEMDIYIPSKSLAIECNGVYWHSDKVKNSSRYHFNKREVLNSAGISLLTIWEDQLINHPEIIKNILLSRCGVYENRIGARECIVNQIDSKEANAFLDKYHLQGKCGGKVRLGLRSKEGELLCLMVLGCRKVGSGWDSKTWELIRYCVRGGWQVVGGASRLMKEFIKEYNPEKITSFASDDISDGGLYKRLGFEKVSDQPGYWYIDPVEMTRHHRFSFSKKRIVEKGMATPEEASVLSEREIMISLGYLRIYDSGQSKWIWTAPE